MNDCINYIGSIKLKYFYVLFLFTVVTILVTIMYYIITKNIDSTDVYDSNSIDVEYEKFLAYKMVEEERKNDILHILKRKINIKLSDYANKILKFYNLEEGYKYD